MGVTDGNVECGWHNETDLMLRHHHGAASIDVVVTAPGSSHSAFRTAVLNDDLESWAANYAPDWADSLDNDPDPTDAWDKAKATATQLVSPTW